MHDALVLHSIFNNFVDAGGAQDAPDDGFPNARESEDDDALTPEPAQGLSLLVRDR